MSQKYDDEQTEIVKEKKEKAKKKEKKALKKEHASKPKMIFESENGRQFTLKELKDMIPKGCDAAYVKTGENKIYWVKGEETGSVDIW